MVTAIAAALFFAASDPSSRPPPLGTPPMPPQWRTVETRYACGGEEMHFVMRYDSEGRGQLVSARRGSHVVGSSDLDRLNEQLGRLVPLSAVVPQCARGVHGLTAMGRFYGRIAHVVIVWTPYAINASPPSPPVYTAPPRRLRVTRSVRRRMWASWCGGRTWVSVAERDGP